MEFNISTNPSFQHHPNISVTTNLPPPPSCQMYKGRCLMPPPFTERTFLLIEFVTCFVITGPLSLFGLFANVIVMRVFSRQGMMANSSIVSLTALALADFGNCLLVIFGAVLVGIWFIADKPNYIWSVRHFINHSSRRPADMLTQISCWITAFAAFERLISVTFPFKVKAIFTPLRSLLVMISIYVGTFFLYLPNLIKYNPAWVQKTENFTRLEWAFSGLISNEVSRIMLILDSIILKFMAIGIVALCNIAIFWKVNISQKFRQHNTRTVKSTPAQQEQNGNKNDSNETSKKNEKSASNETKESRLLRMITTVSIVFVICYAPYIVFSILVTLVWDFPWEYHVFTELTIWAFVSFFQTINSSTNIIIYYKMSSRFREDMLILFNKKIIK